MGMGGLNPCQGGLGHPYIWVKMREEVPQGARLSEGGSATAIWATFSVGLPLVNQVVIHLGNIEIRSYQGIYRADVKTERRKR